MKFKEGEGIWVDLEKMTQSAGPYMMSYGFDLHTLIESIQKVGLINPPLVARNQEGPFDIVSGYRRILALKALGEAKALCRDVTSVLPSPLERFLANFYENLSIRDFNDIEKALVLRKLQEHVTMDKILSSFMPLLSLPSHDGTLKFYLKLLDLNEGAKKSLARKEISIKTAKVFVEIEEEAQQVLFKWIDVLKLNFNQQSKFIEYTQDICIRERMSTAELLSEQFIVMILENPRLNNPQKAKAVLDTLRVKRFPRLARAQEAVERAASKISMPSEASIDYDPYLEDPSYRLEIKFKHGKDLLNVISKLHALHELEAIPELWSGQ
jgi:ParB family chromosome partitioning protein